MGRHRFAGEGALELAGAAREDEDHDAREARDSGAEDGDAGRAERGDFRVMLRRLLGRGGAEADLVTRRRGRTRKRNRERAHADEAGQHARVALQAECRAEKPLLAER